ncbi:transcriptional regulator [Halobiforma nitratireducens JCM 10879]|uniref:Transcriptional regulator n=1 Tax=Halobiforma nitratireducens JCM 10879 TaxID=1227454 RepID=M0MLF3_9EURY|nr:transcriptional regulator [Halobiforma nitratireducens JCM 10879]
MSGTGDDTGVTDDDNEETGAETETTATSGGDPDTDAKPHSIQREILEQALGEYDFQIFKALNEDGRVSDTELAERIDLSRSALRRRRENLLERDIIDVHAVLVLQELDMAYADALVTLDSSASSDERANLISKLIDEELIYSLDSCLGEYDLYVRLWHRSLGDVKSYTWELFEGEEIVDSYQIVPMVHTWKAWDKELDRPE